MPSSPSVRGSQSALAHSLDRLAGDGHVTLGLRSDDLRQVVLAANADGIDLLRRGQPVMAFEQLKYAEAVLVSNPEISADDNELLALTCSNLGCYYRKAGLPRAALRYLGRALKAEKAADSVVPQDACALATTKLNACAALSGVGRHEEAEKLAVVAMQLLAPQDGTAPSREECSLLAVACHNLGAEREHLGRWAPAAVAYRQGCEVARKVLGPKSPLTRTLQERCVQALSKAERNPFCPRRPNILRKRFPGRRPHTTPAKASRWSGRSPPLTAQSATWEVNDLLAGAPGATPQEGQGEDMGLGTDVSPADSDVTRIGMEQELGGGGQPELEEENVEEEDEYTGEMRGRFLPSLTPPDGGRQRNVSILEDHETSGSSQQPRGTWSQSSSAPASRRWSTSDSRQQPQVKAQVSQPHAQQASPALQRFTHGGSVLVGALQEGQELDHDWQPSPPRAKPPFGGGDPVSPPFPQGRGRSASTLVSSSYGQTEQYEQY